MGAYKDEAKNGTWFCKFPYTNWKGEKLTKKKRGFAIKKDALNWEREFLIAHSDSVEMTFREFFELYRRDKKPRIRENTWRTKEAIVESKIMPYLGDLLLSEISKVSIIQWQNELMKMKDDKGQSYSPTYLRAIHAQLSSILNHTCKFYNLKNNVARDVGTMGEKEENEMLFWTREEYEAFVEAIKDKPQSFYAFGILYWCGLRVGELLALTKEKFDFKNNIIKIDQSLQRIDGRNVITPPKTKKSVRKISMPDFLAEEIKDYLDGFYKLRSQDLIFTFTKNYLHHEMNRGSSKANVKRIRVHDLRHSHVSLLIELGFSAMAIADRVGHESIDITFRYAHLFPSKQKGMADSLAQMRRSSANDWDAFSRRMKMFRPEYAQKRAKQIKVKKKKDEQKRKRNRIVNFRATPEEVSLIDKYVELSGLTKQDYFIGLLIDHEIKINADYIVVDAISKEIFRLASVIKKFGKLDDNDEEILLYILEIYEELKKEKTPSMD